ncbi:MAG: hypothetical protein ACUVV0_12500 [Anaerolineae bacterium]
MPVIEFPYSLYDDMRGPVIPVMLQDVNGQWHMALAYVDSGASQSVFRAVEAEKLGLSLETGRGSLMTIGDGSSILVYSHNRFFRTIGR